jgi:hypothetical protein
MTDRLLTVGRSVCERRGYEVTDPGRPWLPPRLAQPTADSTPFVRGATTSHVAIEPLASRDLTPTMLLSRLRNNRGNERFTLFLVDTAAAGREVRRVLHEPPLVAAEDDHGRRTFYNGPDRVALAGGGYAAVRTDSTQTDLVWCEDGDGDDRSLLLVDQGSARSSSDDARGDAGTVVAHLGGIDGLACPDATTFPYSYARDPDDKRFRVSDRNGRIVGLYDGVSAMRANAYVPIPMPLVPEHVFCDLPSVRDEWAVVVAPDGDGTGGSDRPTTFTADGPVSR